MKKFYALTFLFFAIFSATAQINPGICMVTVDDSSKHNIIYYDKSQFSAVDSFILWRETNTPGSYARVMAQDAAAYSQFIDMDTAGDPNIKLHRYKLQVYSTPGGYSNLGPYHTVLYCLQNVQNYAWNLYDIEGVGTGSVLKYLLLRDDNSLNHWHAIDSVSNNIMNTTDPNVNLYPNGQWRLVTKWSISCTPSSRYGNNNEVQGTVVKSKSNITNNKQAGVQVIRNAGSLQLYPNPAHGQTTLRLNFPLSVNSTVSVYNAIGEVVKQFQLPGSKDELAIDTQGLPAGLYVVELSNSLVKVNKRLAVE